MILSDSKNIRSEGCIEKSSLKRQERIREEGENYENIERGCMQPDGHC